MIDNPRSCPAQEPTDTDVQSRDALTPSAGYHRPSHPAVLSALQRLAVSFLLSFCRSKQILYKWRDRPRCFLRVLITPAEFLTTTISRTEKMKITSSAADLPASTSPSLALVHPTTAEKLATWRLNSQVWCGRLSLEAYLRRESVLANQILTRDGGITFWILVDTSAPTSTTRMILASCETYRKRALIAIGNAKVEEVVSHGIGSVYCNPQLRGRGYAGRMMKEIGMKLDTWQQEDGKRADFTVLFSDIGKVRDCENPELGWPSLLTVE